MHFWIAQAVGVVALILFAGSFQLKKTNQILACQTISFLFWAVHFGMLSAWTGAAVLLLNASKTYVFCKHKGRPMWLLVLYVSVFSAVTLVTWEGWHSLLALAGVTFATIAHWQKDSQRLRLLFPPASFSWIAYDIVVRSYSGIMTETIVLVSVMVGLYRNRKKKVDKSRA